MLRLCQILNYVLMQFAIDRDTVMPNVGDRVSVEISGINIEFDSFKFDLDKVAPNCLA